MAAVAVWTFAVALPAIGARATYGARVTADEPQYLTTAISIGEDFDLDISDELENRRFEPYHEIDLNPQTIELDDSARRVSPHDPLLPALLALPMRMGGWIAAKAALAVFAAATAAATLWLAVRRFGVGVGVGGLVVGALFAAPPLVAYATQVYPEMPAALCVVLGLAAVTGPLGRTGRALALASIVALPWLSVKFVPVAAVIAVVLVVRSWPDGRRRLVLDLAVLAAAGAVYVAFHRIVYGGWTAYASGDHFIDGELLVLGRDPDYVGRSRRLMGLLVDRGFGLAAWTPAYLLAVPALVALARRRPPSWSALEAERIGERIRPTRARPWPERPVSAANKSGNDTLATHSAPTYSRTLLVAVFAAGYAVATWVALTMHGWWWPGRQVVVVLPVAVVAVAMLADRLRGVRWLALGGGIVGIFNWVWLVVEASTGRRTLIVDFEETANPVYQVWSALLPDHRHFEGGTVTLTAVWTAVVVATGVWGWFRSRPGPAGTGQTAQPVAAAPDRIQESTAVDATPPAQPDPDAER